MCLVRVGVLLWVSIVVGACRSLPADELVRATAVVEPLTTSQPATQTPTPMSVSTVSPVPTSTATLTPPPSEPPLSPSSTPEIFSLPDVPVTAVWTGEGEPQPGYLLELQSGKLLAPAENFGQAFVEDWLDFILEVNKTTLSEAQNYYHNMTREEVMNEIAETGIIKIPTFIRTGYITGNENYPEVDLRIIEWNISNGLQIEIGSYSGDTPAESPEEFEPWEIGQLHNSMGYFLRQDGVLTIKPRIVPHKGDLYNLSIAEHTILTAIGAQQYMAKGYFDTYKSSFNPPTEITADPTWSHTGYIANLFCRSADFSNESSPCYTPLDFIQSN